MPVGRPNADWLECCMLVPISSSFVCFFLIFQWFSWLIERVFFNWFIGSLTIFYSYSTCSDRIYSIFLDSFCIHKHVFWFSLPCMYTPHVCTKCMHIKWNFPIFFTDLLHDISIYKYFLLRFSEGENQCSQSWFSQRQSF